LYSCIWKWHKSTFCIFCYISWTAYPYLINLVSLERLGNWLQHNVKILDMQLGMIPKNGFKGREIWDFRHYRLAINWNQIFCFNTGICSTSKELNRTIFKSFFHCFTFEILIFEICDFFKISSLKFTKIAITLQKLFIFW
jgi:hypothetical protein